MRKYLALAGLLPFIFGCASRTVIQQGTPKLVNRPEIGSISEAEIGEVIVAKGKVYQRSGITLKNTITTGSITANPGFYNAVSQDSGWIYFSNIQNLQGAALCLSKKDPKDLRLPAFAPAATYHFRPTAPAVFEQTDLDQLVDDGFMQELVFSGKAGTKARFLYRELFANASRAPFAQDFDHDLETGNLISFKGSRLEILEATSTKIKFRLIQGFSK